MNTPPSMQSFDYSLLWQWTIVIIMLLLAVYTMIIIKKEKNLAIEESQWLNFFNITIPIPTWWTQTASEKDLLKFERTDTRYDWFCTVKRLAVNNHPLEEILYQYLTEEKIEYDPEVIIQTEPRYLFKNQDVAHYFIQAIRIEGTATQDKVDRLYNDIYLFRKDPESDIYMAESRSSVLNGLVEGPFFEDAISELKVLKRF